jgi:hypothetical protein
MGDDLTPVQDRAKELRSEIEAVKVKVKQLADDLKSGDVVEAGDNTDKYEQIANAILAFRHLEDAKMRIGKVIQATVGESVYDTPAK